MITELFKEHAAPEAIRAKMEQAEANRRHWDWQVKELGKLLNHRQGQISKGEWPRKESPRATVPGCTCQKCGSVYRVDVIVPDELWERIRLGMNLLCGPCIIGEVEELKEFAAYELKRLK